MFSLIWMQMTAPMKNEISNTMPMESTPSCSISLMYCFMNILMRSGMENVLPIKSRYLPKAAMYFVRNMI